MVLLHACTTDGTVIGLVHVHTTRSIMLVQSSPGFKLLESGGESMWGNGIIPPFFSLVLKWQAQNNSVQTEPLLFDTSPVPGKKKDGKLSASVLQT